jgi:hypothetical protein
MMLLPKTEFLADAIALFNAGIAKLMAKFINDLTTTLGRNRRMHN